MITIELSKETATLLESWLTYIENVPYDDQYASHLTTESSWFLTELRNKLEELS